MSSPAIDRPHVFIRQEAALAVSLDREITPTSWRVLIYLTSILGYENAILVGQREISIELEIDRSQVSKAFKLLRSKGIIELIECPLKPVYRLNPHYAWRGTHSKWQEER